MRMTIFMKIILMMLLILVPLLSIYSFSSRTNEQVIEKEITAAKLQNVLFFQQQMENALDQLKLSAITLTRDPDVRRLGQLEQITSSYDRLQLTNTIRDKLVLNGSASNWDNQLTVISKENGEAVSPKEMFAFPFESSNPLAIPQEEAGWQYVPVADGTEDNPPDSDFVSYIGDVYHNSGDPDKSKILVQILFPAKNLVRMLEEYKSGGEGAAILYSPGYAPLTARSSDSSFVRSLTAHLQPIMLGTQGSFKWKVAGKDYLVDYVKSAKLGWYVIDSVPLNRTFAPILRNQRIFILALFLLLLAGAVVAFGLYMQIQVPIRELLRNVQSIKRGDYSQRIQKMPNNEFRLLNLRFNEMAEQIQRLVEQVLAEQIQAREAMLKQLQSQINPHFLYNCLFFIKNMAKMNKTEAIEEMALNLGDYFRYTTRVDQPVAPLREEVELVRNYLTIQQLRVSRLQFELDVPAELQSAMMPRLVIQPLVENAVKHALEKRSASGTIRVRGWVAAVGYCISVEDDGYGMPHEDMENMRAKLASPEGPKTSYGLWNVHQRLARHFGAGSGLSFAASELGGLKVVISWQDAAAKAGEG